MNDMLGVTEPKWNRVYHKSTASPNHWNTEKGSVNSTAAAMSNSFLGQLLDYKPTKVNLKNCN